MQKPLPSAPEGSGESSARETTAASRVAEADGKAAPPVPAQAPVSTPAPSTPAAAASVESAPRLVWPPPDEELDTWQVIPLGRQEPPQMTAGSLHDAPTAILNRDDIGGAAAKTRARPFWLVNHTRPDGTPLRNQALERTTPLFPRVADEPDDRTAPRDTSSNTSAPAMHAPTQDRRVAARDRRVATRDRRAAGRLGESHADPSAPLASPLASPLALPLAEPSTAMATPSAEPPAVDARWMMDADAADATLYDDTGPSAPVRSPGWSARLRRIALVLLALLAVGQAVYIGARLLIVPTAPVAATAPAAVPPAGDGSITPAPTTPSVDAAAAGVQEGTTPSTASVPIAPPAAPAPTRGWVVIDSPLNLTVLRQGELLGNSAEGRLPLPAGRQELELVNDSVGFRAVTTVQVPPGRQTTLPVELPQSTLDIRATPAARVFVDGRDVGDAPVTQLALPVGPHEVRFEHPELGERRVTVLVRVGATAIASTDFSR